MSDAAISRFPVPRLEELPADIRERIETVAEKTGFVPNVCLYCVVAHGAVARIRARDPLIADQVAVDWRKADVTDRQRAMLGFAVKLAVRPAEVTEADLEELRSHGLSDDDIWDVGAITALFAMSNRLAHLSAMRPNDDFYLMGRLSKAQMERLRATGA